MCVRHARARVRLRARTRAHAKSLTQVEDAVNVKVFWPRVRMDDQTLPTYYGEARDMVYHGMRKLPGVKVV